MSPPTPTVDDVRALLEKGENVSMDGPEADAYNYLLESVDDGLWDGSSSHEALRLWCLCHDVLERAVKGRGP